MSEEKDPTAMAPDLPYGLEYLVADIEAENRRKDEYLKGQLNEFVQKHVAILDSLAETNRRIDKHLRGQLDEPTQQFIDVWDGLYLYGDAVPPLAVPVSSGEEV